MGIIITSIGPEYGRLSVELPFSYTLNLKGVWFNLYAEPKKNWVSFWLHPRMVRDGHTIARRGVLRERVPDLIWGWARTHHSPIWSWAQTRSWPNMELGADASRPNLELSRDAPLPELGLGASLPNLGLGVGAPLSNLELGAGMPWSNVKLSVEKT
jgi:hypothetical protein